jgi:hypothetical protein
MITSILLILVGAIISGAFQLGFNVRDRTHEAETILTAIASEVDSVCRLIRHQQYLEHVSAAAQAIRNGTWDGKSLVIDVRENYFSVYEGLAPKLGMLRPRDAAKIVNFYAYCKSLIDSFRVDGPAAQTDRDPYVAAGILSSEALFAAVLNLGSEIVQLPKLPIHEAVNQAALSAPPEASK